MDTLTGIGVTPELLSDAAAAIAETLDIVDVPSVPAIGGDSATYGHAGLGTAVAGFGEAVRVASGLLADAAEGAVTGLRADARSYTARERETLGTLLGARSGREAGR